MKKDFEKLAEKLGVGFDDIGFLRTALTHRSYLNEHHDVKEHNERLEFLGDAVLELVVTEHLYKNFDNPEGDLTNWRSALVKTETISGVAKELDVEEYILMSRGEAKSLGRSRQLILANSFEAIVGSIFLDQGLEEASKFIKKNLIVKLEKILKEKSYVDPKSLLQEVVQDLEGVTPSYDVLEEVGPDHDKTFTIGVFVGEKLWGKGVGPSKQAAQQSAAEDAIKKSKLKK
jgi:ribonuclease-3